MTGADVVLRPDAGAAIGLGHLRRCLTLAQALARAGASALMLVPDETAALTARAGFPAVTLRAEPGTDADLAALITAAADAGAGAVVVDSYAVDADYLDELRAQVPAVAVIDDLCAFPFSAQLVANGRLGAERAPYRATGGDTEFLLGAEFALLRRELWEGPPPRPAAGERPRVLIAAGGSDPSGLATQALAALELIELPLEVAIVAGPLAERTAELGAAAHLSRHEVEIHCDPPDPIALMAASDAALSAGGGMLVELAAVGTPTIAVEVAANQRPGIDALSAAGAVIDGGSSDRPDLAVHLAALAAALIASPERRAALAAAGTALYDGQGALRVAAKIAELACGRVTSRSPGSPSSSGSRQRSEVVPSRSAP